MPVYTLQLNPDSLTGLYWVDLGNNTHVELKDSQKNWLIKLIKSSAEWEEGTGMHPPTFSFTNTIVYDDNGQLDTVLGDEKKVKSGIGIINVDAFRAAAAAPTKSGGYRRRGVRKSLRKSSRKRSYKRSCKRSYKRS